MRSCAAPTFQFDVKVFPGVGGEPGRRLREPSPFLARDAFSERLYRVRLSALRAKGRAGYQTGGRHAPAPQTREATAQHEEEVVGVVAQVPDELASHLDDHQVVPVELADDTRLPALGEGRELVGKVDRLHGGCRPVRGCGAFAPGVT